MHVISEKKLREFWQSPDNAAAELPLRAWIHTVKRATWQHFGDVKGTYSAVDKEKGGPRTIFDIGGNKYRLIAVIDYERHRVFIRFVLSHKEYDKENWKKDTFGTNWGKPGSQPPQEQARKRSRRKGK